MSGDLSNGLIAIRLRGLALALAALTTACGQGNETVSHTDSEGKSRAIEVEDSGGKRTVTSDDGVIRAEGSKDGGHARFPGFAPQYPGARVQSAVDLTAGSASTGGFSQHIITMQTSDAPEAVITFYQDKAKAAGKQVKQLQTATGPMLVIGGTSLMNMEAGVTAMPMPSGATSINVTVQARLSSN